MIRRTLLLGMASTIAALLLASLLRPMHLQAQEPPPVVPTIATNLNENTEGIPPGHVLIEGDIIMPLEQFEITQSTQETSAVWNPSFWPGGSVSYMFSNTVTTVSRTLMINGMQIWENLANIEFSQCPNNNCPLDENSLLIQHSNTANSSFVGMQGGSQVVNISAWNNQAVIVHELGHALGYWHTMARSDRSTFITVITPSITLSQVNQFAIRPGAPFYGPYDFGSIMHYGQCAFSNNNPCPPGRTILVNPPFAAAWQNAIGTASAPSRMDALTMSFIYAYADYRFADVTYLGQNESGTFFQPYKTVTKGAQSTPEGGTLWLLQPGNYETGGRLTKRMTIRAPLGDVRLTP